MNELYTDLDVTEHYAFKYKHDYLLMNVNTLDVFILDSIEYDMVKEINKYGNNGLNTLLEKYGELAVDKNLSELSDNGILKKKNRSKVTHATSNNDSDLINAIDILISEDCNLACKYCFVKNGQYRGKSGLMKLDVGEKAIDFLIRASGTEKDVYVNFFGGEPLINFQVLDNTVTYALILGEKHTKHFHFSLTTNGTLLSDEIVNFISKHNISLLISIDGDVHSHNQNRPLSGGGGSYSDIIANLKKLDQKNISYAARATVTSFTVTKIAENFEHLISLRFKRLHIENALAPRGKVFINTKDDITKIKKQYAVMAKRITQMINSGQCDNLEKFPLPIQNIETKNTVVYSCSAGRGLIAIDIKGDIYLCHRLVGKKKFLLGNVIEDTYNPEWSDVVKTSLSVVTKKLCKKCWARYICGGGCYGINYEFNNDISLTPQIYCQLKKYSIKMALIVYANSVQ